MVTGKGGLIGHDQGEQLPHMVLARDFAPQNHSFFKGISNGLEVEGISLSD
jgi:hypothetical protein